MTSPEQSVGGAHDAMQSLANVRSLIDHADYGVGGMLAVSTTALREAIGYTDLPEVADPTTTTTTTPAGTSTTPGDVLDGGETLRSMMALTNVRALIDNADFGDYDGLMGAVRTSNLRDAIDYPLVYPDPADVASGEEAPPKTVHALVDDSDGDGWNEPLQQRWHCTCGVEFANWTQTDPENTGMPDLIHDVMPAYTTHILTAHNILVRVVPDGW